MHRGSFAHVYCLTRIAHVFDDDSVGMFAIAARFAPAGTAGLKFQGFIFSGS